MPRLLPLVTLAPLLLAACQTADRNSPAPDPATSANDLDRAVTLLVADVKSSNPTTRARAIEALQDLRDQRAVDALRAGFADPEWVVRFAAVMAAGRREAADLKPELLTLQSEERSPNVRVALLYAFNRLGDTSHTSNLAGYLASPLPDVRANAALVLGLLRNPSAIPVLKSHSKDPHPLVAFEITAALARLGDHPAQMAIVAMATSRVIDEEWDVIAVCGDLPREVAVNPLLMQLNNPPPLKDAPRADALRGRLLAARALGKLNSPQGAEFILNPKHNYLRDPDPEVRALSALALGEILTTKGSIRLHDLLDDPNPNVRLAAAAALANIWSRAEAAAGK